MKKEVIAWIKEKVESNDYRAKLHAIQRINERGILPGDIKEALLNSKLIEDYPDDKRGHSCLVWGSTKEGRDLHMVCGISEDNLWIITIYEPTPDKWETPERRRKE